MLKFYTKYIAQGKGVFYCFLAFAVFIRVYFYFNINSDDMDYLRPNDSYIWNKIVPFLSNKFVNISASFGIIALSALYIHFANVGATFLRIRSMLPTAFFFFLFSYSPFYWVLSPLLLIAFFFSYMLSIFFNNYDAPFKQDVAAKVGFYLSLSSLFEPLLLCYFPIIWICLYILRNFNFKSFLASTLGLWLWYIPLFSMVFFLDDYSHFSTLYEPYFQFSTYKFPILYFDIQQYVVLVLSALFILLLIIDNSINSFGEKIKVRLCLSMLTLIELFSMLLMIFVDRGFYIGLTVTMVCFSLHLSHFYSLAKKIKTMFFLFLFAVITVVILSFHNMY